MKKLFVAIALLGFAGVAQAKSVGPAGCGLGNMLFGAGDGKVMQLLGATTNGSSASQTFGITSGTSNCVDGRGMAKLDAFVEANQLALANDAARGQGETVISLAKILGCQDQSAVGTAMKSNFEAIFPSQNANARDVANSIRKSLKNNAVACNHLG